MDPRPFNYQFCRPRPNNKTYQSYNAYQSLYHMGRIDPILYHQNLMKDNYIDRMNRYSSVRDNPVQSPPPPEASYQPQRQVKHLQSTAVNTDKYSDRGDSNCSVRSRSSALSSELNHIPVKPSVLASYGSNSLSRGQNNQPGLRDKPEVNIVRSNFHDGSQIYQRQQKPFDIINFSSRPTQPLWKYPKLHLEHLMLERGMDNKI